MHLSPILSAYDSTPTGQRVNRPSLDLGELRQVLQDEELARRLQAEEEELLRGVKKKKKKENPNLTILGYMM